jgi:CheY-like chemotaxis protein
MPKMDGLTFLIEVKRRHPACARVLMTAYADMQLVVRAMTEGEIHRFLSKPYKAIEFRKILEEAMALARIVEQRERQPQGRTVLVAHDSQITQATLRLLLTPAYQVLATGNGIEALTLLSTRKIDALVIGIGLELLDGCAITTYLKKEKRSAIPIAIWSSGVAGPYGEYLRECGADLVVDDQAPGGPELLLQYLRKVLA